VVCGARGFERDSSDCGGGGGGGVVDEGKLLGHHRHKEKHQNFPLFHEESANGSCGSFPFSVESPSPML
jgi:hypothetical protein